MDVQATIKLLMERGITVVSLDLPAKDLASAEGRMMMQMFAVFAEFERSRIAERTKDGIARARAEGRSWGDLKRLILLRWYRKLRLMV